EQKISHCTAFRSLRLEVCRSAESPGHVDVVVFLRCSTCVLTATRSPNSEIYSRYQQDVAQMSEAKSGSRGASCRGVSVTRGCSCMSLRSRCRPCALIQSWAQTGDVCALQFCAPTIGRTGDKSGDASASVI